jgi:hypothetical protein
LDDVAGCLRRMKEQMNQGQQLELLRTLNRALIEECPKTREDCVYWARDLFDTLYRNDIQQLLHNFPPDQVCLNYYPKYKLKSYFLRSLHMDKNFGLAQNGAHIH